MAQADARRDATGQQFPRITVDIAYLPLLDETSMNDNRNPETEAATRELRIAHSLTARGWTVVSFTPEVPIADYARHAVRDYPTDNGPANYALFVDGRLLGIVEANTLSLEPQNALVQAERYARGANGTPFNFRGIHVPFLYATDGEHTWFHDVRSAAARSRQIFDFHAPTDLVEIFDRDFDAACVRLAATPNVHERLRSYQKDANSAVEQAIAARKRHLLVTMAAGTGKTFTTINLIRRLFEVGVVRRVLYLVDQRALADQVAQAFADFPLTETLKFDRVFPIYRERFLRDEFDGKDSRGGAVGLPSSSGFASYSVQTFVCVCTVQSLAMGLGGRNGALGSGALGEPTSARRIGVPNFLFDLLIADECLPRSTTGQPSDLQAMFDYFDAIKIGLTATPTRYAAAYFADIVYRYDFRQAVSDGYLVDYQLVSIHSGVRLNGVFLQAGEAARVTDVESRRQRFDSMDDEREYDVAEIERKTISHEKSRKILEQVHTCALAHEGRFGRFPKTLIFAINIAHAEQLVSLARDVFDRGENFVQKVTSDVFQPFQHIRAFRDTAHPCVLISVDMLLADIAFPDVEFVVLLRPVKSRSVLTQMLGLGARTSGSLQDKSYFTVFDCFGGSLFQYFSKTIDATVEPVPAYVRKNHVRPDANWVALNAIRAILDAAESFEVSIEGVTVKIDAYRNPVESWPVDTWGIEEEQDGPWPQSVLLDCSWHGGKTQIVASAVRATGIHRGLVSILLVARRTSQQLLWINVAACLREDAEKEVPLVAWFSLATRIPDNPKEKLRRNNRVLAVKALVKRSSLTGVFDSSMDAFTITISGGAVEQTAPRG